MAFSGVPNKGDKIRSGYINPTFSWAQNWAEWRRNPHVLGSPKRGTQRWAGGKMPLGAVLKGGPYQEKKSGSLRTTLALLEIHLVLGALAASALPKPRDARNVALRTAPTATCQQSHLTSTTTIQFSKHLSQMTR